MINRRQFNAGLIAASMPLVAFKEAIAATKKINLTIASSHPTVIPWVGPLQSVIVAKANTMLKERGSDFEIEWTEAYGGALYNFNDTLEAVTNNLTDADKKADVASTKLNSFLSLLQREREHTFYLGSR